MRKQNCPYFSETAPVCDDGECGCLECMERIAELRKKGEEYDRQRKEAFA